MTAASLLALLTPLVLKWLIDQVLPRQRDHGLLIVAAVLIFLSYQGRTVLDECGQLSDPERRAENGSPIAHGCVAPLEPTFRRLLREHRHPAL